jgi:hypothetical protein
MNAPQDVEKMQARARSSVTSSADFRVTFARMADDALIDRNELAALLATTPNAVSMLAFRQQLPAKAFPSWRRAVWFAGDIRRWLDQAMVERSIQNARQPVSAPSTSGPGRARSGRPRKSVDNH